MTTPLTRRDVEEVLDQRLANHPTHTELDDRLAKLNKNLDERFAKQRAEIAKDTRATMTVLLEDAFKRFRVIDDQYKDLPGRVAKLERAVFTPPRARRKRAG